MSVLIKGMEMPKNCAVCRLEKDLFGRAICFGYEDGRALHKDDLPPVGNEERRPDWCPLVPVPPHGRLIDADDFDKRIRLAGGMCEEELTEDFKDGIQTVLAMMKTQPTIIPAEECE